MALICYEDEWDYSAAIPLANDETENTAEPNLGAENPSSNPRDSGFFHQAKHETKRSGTGEDIEIALMIALREELDSGGALQAKVRQNVIRVLILH